MSTPFCVEALVRAQRAFQSFPCRVRYRATLVALSSFSGGFARSPSRQSDTVLYDVHTSRLQSYNAMRNNAAYTLSVSRSALLSGLIWFHLVPCMYILSYFCRLIITNAPYSTRVHVRAPAHVVTPAAHTTHHCIRYRRCVAGGSASYRPKSRRLDVTFSKSMFSSSAAGAANQSRRDARTAALASWPACSCPPALRR